MKICDLTQSYAATGGGVRTYLHAKREYLERATDHEYLLVVPGERDGVQRDGRVTVCMVKSPPVPGSSVYRLLLRSDRVYRILCEEAPDVVECQCSYNLPWTALQYRKRSGATVIGAYMTDGPTAYVEAPLRKVAGRRVAGAARGVADRYVRALYNRCDANFTISPADAERLRGIGVENVRPIPLGVDTELFHPGRRDGELRRELGVGDDGLLLVYVGRIDPEKRAEVVVDAFERLPGDLPATLLMVGEGSRKAEIAGRAAGNPRVHLRPFVSDRGQLARILASSDMYVSAMPFETFGLSVIEAQACGLPVVGVASGAMLERVPEGTGILGRVDDPDDLAANIATLANGRRNEMGRRSRELVLEGFSWDRTFERVLDLYREAGAGG
jgi:alpha-1,6-mannosyltransferase